jgi:hypothetical protein
MAQLHRRTLRIEHIGEDHPFAFHGISKIVHGINSDTLASSQDFTRIEVDFE